MPAMTEGSPMGFVESEDALHEEAARIAGSDDFGDPSYLEGLRILLAAYDAEARFNDYGRAAARRMVLDTLVKRLRAEEQWAAAPEVLGHEIQAPIVICGLVRTGSTALHYLMGQDPEVQPLQYWLACNPQPRPARSEWAANPDFQRAKAEIDAMYEADASLKAVHFMMPDGPEECRHLLMQEFTDDGFEVNNHVPSYSEWYQQADMLMSYRRHRDLLKLIGSTDTRRPWLLKYPVHVRFLRTFLEIYPDACIVQTHRDPLAVFPSYVSLISGFRALNESPIDKPEIARRQLELWATGLEDAIDLRRKRDASQFYDVHFSDFVSDPVGTVRSIYSHFGRSLSDAGELALQAWQEQNPQHKHGRHEYTREALEIGITNQVILDRFGEYMDYYGLKPESQP
jgi:hypothetical protein